MVAPVVKTGFYKLFLPAILITAGCLRPSIAGAIYVGLGLLCPLLPSTTSSMNAAPIAIRAVLGLLLLFTVGMSIGQITYQVLQSSTSDSATRKACNMNYTIPKILRIAGFEKFSTDELKAHPEATHVVLPEAIALIGTLITAVIVLALRHSTVSTGSESNVQVVRDNASPRVVTPWLSTALGDTLRRASNMIIVILIGAVSCIQPSILSAPYFLMFLFMLTWYAMHKSIQHEGFNRIKRFIILYAGFHFLAIFVFQIPAVNQLQFFDEGRSLVARLLGLSTMLRVECDTWYMFSAPDPTLEWPNFLNPFAILLLFQLAIWQYSFTKHGTHCFTRLDNGDDGSSVHEERRGTNHLIFGLLNTSYVSRSLGLDYIPSSQRKRGATRQNPIAESDAISEYSTPSRERRASTVQWAPELLGDDEEEERGNEVRLKKITSQMMERQRISQIFKGPRSEKSVASRGLIMVVTFFFSQAYVVGLIAMMAWAMIYHSVFGLLLMLIACVIWIFPNSRKAAFSAAPFILGYVEFLLIAQYICSMDIRTELNDLSKDSVPVKSALDLVGFIVAPGPVMALVTMVAKLLLSLPISLLLRLARRDKKFEALNDAEKARRLANYGTFASISQMEQSNAENGRNGARADRSSSGLTLLFGCLSRLLVTLWLPVVCGFLIFASVWNKASLFTIGYFGFFAVSVLCFKTSFTAFRHTYFLILTLLTAYTSVVIILSYIYQFQGVAKEIHDRWKDSSIWTEAIGLESSKESENSLFVRIFPSILLYIVTMLQLKFFHNQWKELTECKASHDTAASVVSQQPSTSGTNETGGAAGKRKDSDGILDLMKPSPTTSPGEGSSAAGPSSSAAGAAPGIMDTDIPLRELSYSSDHSSSPSSTSPLHMKVEMDPSEGESSATVTAYQPPEGSSPGPEIELDYGKYEADDVPIMAARPKSGKPQWRKSKLVEQSDWEKFNQKIGAIVGDVIDVMWRIAEVHISKLVFLLIIILVCNTESTPSNYKPIKDSEGLPAMKVYAIYVPLLVLISLAVCLPRKAASLFSILACAYLAAVAILKMIYQLSFFKSDLIPPFRDVNCSGAYGDATFMEWLGFRKVDYNKDSNDGTFNLIKDIIASVLLLVIQSVVFYRCAFSRAQAEINGAAPVQTSSRYVVFPSTSPLALDRDLTSLFKWLIDYSFYKFGVEISIIFMAIHIWVRMDAIAVCTSIFIILIVLSPRPLIRALWPILVCYLAVIFPLQYAMHVGFPPLECIAYPWQHQPGESTIWNVLNSLSVLFNLSMYKTLWSGGFFISDFLALVAVASQLYVFSEESDSHPAGDNKSIYVGREIAILPDNPHYDYIAKQRSFVDYAKIFVFQYGHWVTLLMVLIAGLGGTSLFALGYIVLSLSMLWEGNNLYLMKNHRLTLFRWKLVLAYTAVVIMLKTALQLVGCSLNLKDVCVLRQLFAIKCVCRNIIINNSMDPNSENEAACPIDANEANIGLDTFALAFIIFQMRILGSWYFQYVITEFRSEIVLANRGAVLSNQLIEKEMKEQEEQQSKKFDDIRDRTKAIRERYEQLQKEQDRTDIVDPDTYGAERQQQHKERVRLRPTSSIINEDDPLPSYDYRDNLEEAYQPAKRAGDYYMFDYDPEQDELKKDKESFVPEVDPGASDFNKLDPTQLAYAAVAKDLDIKDTLEAANRAEKSVRGGELDKKQMMQDVVTPKTRAASGAESSTSVVSGAPGTSGSSEEEELEVDETQNESKILYFARFGLKMLTNSLDWMAAFLNRRSREHRYVAFVLSKERTKLKEKKGQSLNDVSRRLSELHNDAKSERGLMVVQSESDIEKMEEAAINSWQKRNVLARLTNAIGYCIGAHTDTVCYVLAILCHARGAGVVTLPLPLMVFFWGTLSSPRPSKFFWVAMTLYTELIIVMKFIAQFTFLPWNSPSATNLHMNDYYWIPDVLGLQRKEYYPTYEVALLMALFFHRYMLRKLGLWKDANVSETFDGDFTLSERSRAGGNEGFTNPAMDAYEHVEATDDSDSQLTMRRRNKGTVPKTAVGAGKSLHLAPSAAPKSVQFEIKETAAAATVTTTSLRSQYVPPLWMEVSRDASKTGEERTKTEDDTQSSSSSTRTATGEATVNGGEVTTTAATAVDEVDGGEADKERSGMTRFIYQLFYPKFRYIRDLYPSMFGLDVICFLIIVFGYSSFGDGGSGSVVNDIQSNRVPLAFVLMMIISSFMIVVDRGLYLRKAIRCKLAYQFIIVIFMHVWIFFTLPAVTKVAAFKNTTAQVLYFVKSVYLLVSAWQIRNGYPQLCVGNLLMHSYGLANMVFFKVFMAVPFVWELRTAIDWTWTDTSMPLFDFFNMEQFYATIYNLKCARAFEAAYPAPRGEKKGVMVKYMMGLPFVIFIVLLIWCPLLAFSLLNKVGSVLPPEQVTLTVAIEGYPPLYTIEAQGRELMSWELNEKDYDALKLKYSEWSNSEARPEWMKKGDLTDQVKRGRQAVAFLDDYAPKDLMTIRFRPESQSAWPISEASRSALLSELKELTFGEENSRETVIHVNIELLRKRENKAKEPVKHSAAFSVVIDESLRDRLLLSIDGGGNATSNTRLTNAIPRFIRVPNEGEISAADLLLLPATLNESARTAYSDINLRFFDDTMMWTGQLRTNESENAIDILAPKPGKIAYPSPFGPLDYIEVVATVDRVFPSVLSKFVSGGIIAMYIALVLFIGKIIRGVLTNGPLNVMITEIPNPDHLLKICLDIYLVREARDFILEQDLFAKLIFLFRSPATLIKWTRLRPKRKEE